jgi:twinkle protein
VDESIQLSEEHARWLEDARKIPSEVAARYGLVSTPAGDLAFQYILRGRVSYLKVRRDNPTGKADYRIEWCELEGSRVLSLWNEDCLTDRSALASVPIITEGEIDALSFLAAGELTVVSVPNGSPSDRPGEGKIVVEADTAYRYLWKGEGTKLKDGLQSCKKIIIATDGDQKGRVLRDELAVRLGRTRCWYVTYPAGCKDANDVLVIYGVEAVQKLIADAKPIVPNKLVSFSEIPRRADPKRYSTGWGPEFDQRLMVCPPQLIVVMGSPNHGKTEWTISFVANLARLHGLKGTILQFEDDVIQRVEDALSRYAQAWSGTQVKGGIEEEPKAWIDRMFKTISPSEEFDEDKQFDLGWLSETIEEAALRHGHSWVLIDPWNELEQMWEKGETEANYIKRAIRYLKRIGRRYQITIIIVAHPTKESGRTMTIEDASLYDVSGGAAWNDKADLGVIVWAEDVKQPERDIKICKSKNFKRFGVPGIVRMEFDWKKSVYRVIPRKG